MTRSPSSPRFGAGAAGALALAAGAAALAIGPASASTRPAPTPPPGRHRDVSPNLWEWNWLSVARECTNVLGPDGYARRAGRAARRLAVARLHELRRADRAPVVGRLPAGRLQPDQPLRQRAAVQGHGQDLPAGRREGIVDAVINHMTGQGHKSYGGVEYTHFSYPDYNADQLPPHGTVDCRLGRRRHRRLQRLHAS